MIIDSHVHYCEPASSERPYDPDGMVIPPCPIEGLLTAAREAGVDKVVQVTPSMMGSDNRYSIEGAHRFPDRVFAIIGRFDPLAPDVDARLRAYREEDPLLVGIRFTLLSPKTERWLSDGALDDFFEAAQKYDVAVQLQAQDRAQEIRDTTRRFPGVRFLIDHMGVRAHASTPIEQVFRDWNQVAALAREPNVWVKVSYFPEAARGSESYPYPRAQGYFQDLYEKAGASKLIWGSNYPPVLRACSYGESLDFVRSHCAFISKPDLAAILGGTLIANFSPKRLKSS